MLEENNIELDSPLIEEDEAYLELIQWWEKRRKLYNILLFGFAGLLLLGILFFDSGYYYNIWEFIISRSLSFLIQIVFFNLFYMSGWMLDALVKYYSKSQFGINVRWFFYWAGVVISAMMLFGSI